VSEQRYHRIEISVPVPDGRSAQGKVIDTYEAELEVLFAKLPADATKKDWVTTPRTESGPRKTIEDRVKERVEAELAARDAHAALAAEHPKLYSELEQAVPRRVARSAT
jgi:hypothetical protein